MTIDITDQFEAAAAANAATPWTHGGVSRALEALITAHPGARVDWESGDEEWARVLEHESDEIIALICAKIPLAFIRGGTQLSAGAEGLVQIRISSAGDAAYKVDPYVLDRIFGRSVSRSLDYNTVSADDVWWATV